MSALFADRTLWLAAGAFVGSLWFTNLMRARRSGAPGASETLDLEVIDFEAFFRREEDPERYRRECEKVSDCCWFGGVFVCLFRVCLTDLGLCALW